MTNFLLGRMSFKKPSLLRICEIKTIELTFQATKCSQRYLINTKLDRSGGSMKLLKKSNLFNFDKKV